MEKKDGNRQRAEDAAADELRERLQRVREAAAGPARFWEADVECRRLEREALLEEERLARGEEAAEEASASEAPAESPLAEASGVRKAPEADGGEAEGDALADTDVAAEPAADDAIGRAAEAARPHLPLYERLTSFGSRVLQVLEERRHRRALSEVASQKAERSGQILRLVGSAVVLLAAAWLLTMGFQRSFRQSAPEVKTFVSDWKTAPSSVDRDSFQTQYEGRLETLTDRVAALTAQLSDMDARVGRLKAEAARETTRQKAAREKAAASGEALLEAPPAGVASPPVMTAEEARKAMEARRDARPRLAVVKLAPEAEGAAAGRDSIAVAEHPVTATLSRLTRDAPIARNRAQGAAPRTYLPAGTFMRAVVLSGVTASTGGAAAANPMPMLLEVTDAAHLPNDFRSAVERCFLTASATGDLSSERVLVRLDRLSCMKKDGRAVDVRVQGYVTGEDGKTGVRGRLVSRSGQAIANAVFLGALSGLGEAVSLSAQNTTTYSSGASSRSVTNPWKAGLGEGMSDAMDRIVDYYLRLADKIFPVLELDGGRTVEAVLAQGVTIAEKDEAQEAPSAPESSPVTKTLTKANAARRFNAKE